MILGEELWVVLFGDGTSSEKERTAQSLTEDRMSLTPRMPLESLSPLLKIPEYLGHKAYRLPKTGRGACLPTLSFHGVFEADKDHSEASHRRQLLSTSGDVIWAICREECAVEFGIRGWLHIHCRSASVCRERIRPRRLIAMKVFSNLLYIFKNSLSLLGMPVCSPTL